MTPTTLQALRRLLFFTRQEAARWIAAGPDRPDGVSDRAWRQWETGEFAVPADVAHNISALAAWRETATRAARGQINADIRARGEPERISLVWYETLADWLSLPGRDPALWRPQQSACAAILGAAPEVVRLVPFVAGNYETWLENRPDSDKMRTVWAAKQP